MPRGQNLTLLVHVALVSRASTTEAYGNRNHQNSDLFELRIITSIFDRCHNNDVCGVGGILGVAHTPPRGTNETFDASNAKRSQIGERWSAVAQQFVMMRMFYTC